MHRFVSQNNLCQNKFPYLNPRLQLKTKVNKIKVKARKEETVAVDPAAIKVKVAVTAAPKVVAAVEAAAVEALVAVDHPAAPVAVVEAAVAEVVNLQAVVAITKAAAETTVAVAAAEANFHPKMHPTHYQHLQVAIKESKE